MRLEEHDLFTFFPPEQRAQLIEAVAISSYDEPHVLFEEGDDGGAMYLVLDGEVEISGMTASGQYQLISALEAGDFFGEFSAFDRGARSARAEVPLCAKVAKLPGEALLKALDDAPIETTRRFISQMIRRIRRFHSRFFTDVVRSQKMLLVGELTNSVIHDIKSPMGIITGTTEMLKDKHRDMETQHMCELIDMQVKRVMDMSREVLDFVRGNTTLIQKEVNLKDLFPYFMLMNEEYFRRQGVKLIVNPVDVEFSADPDKIVRVLQNLSNNAVQAMTDGGRVEISGRLDGKWVEITVTDNGPGVPEEIRAQLFEPFVSIGKNGGTGLGTTIAKSLVQSHGGTIDFKSSNAGTRFVIRLPQRLQILIGGE